MEIPPENMADRLASMITWWEETILAIISYTKPDMGAEDTPMFLYF